MVAKTESGRLLEIGFAREPDDTAFVFHAMDAKPYQRKQYKTRAKQLCQSRKPRQKKKRTAAPIPPPPGPEATSQEIDTYFSKYSRAQIEKAGHLRPLDEEETAWVNGVSAEARKRFKARQNRAQLNLALPASELARFTKYAEKKHTPPSTLARAWLLERLDREAKDA